MVVDRQLPILIADHNRAAILTIRHQLAQIGLMHADEARRADAAIAKLRRQGYALVIADCSWRNAGAAALLQAARRPWPLATAAFIFTRPRGFALAPADLPLPANAALLSKPFGAGELRAAIDALCGTQAFAA